MPLLGPDGEPISSSKFNKKAKPPILGERLGSWAGEEVRLLMLPGGGAIQFDLSRLTLTDFRQMKEHYQINASLAVLTFMLHQMEWHIECEDKKARDFYEETMRKVWTRLVRAKSQAFWAGFSPNILQWENDLPNRRVVLDKVKDLIPEECYVNWKVIDGYSPPGTNMKPKIKIFDGIRQDFWPYPIPVANSYWYPLLMENGDYYGRKLLKPAFVSWFFSLLLHLFANRYYERFGEPVPVGRAPFDEDVELEGTSMRGNVAMEQILRSIRNRSVAVLPSQKTPVTDAETNPDYDYQIEYLESQMRGADFERYMTRLDEEMSLALFTPILLMRTADVGSYNLGVGHMKVYLWMLNAISDDWKTYIDKYILRPMRDFNFGVNAEMPEIKFRRLGVENGDLVRDLINTLVSGGKLKLDVRELGEMAGLTMEQVGELVIDQPEPAEPGSESEPEIERGEQTKPPDNAIRDVTNKIYTRVYPQARAGIQSQDFSNLSLGFQRQFEDTLVTLGYTDATQRTQKFYAQVESYYQNLASISEHKTTDTFMQTFRAGMDFALEGALN
jgi:hypothetical protein